MTGGIDLNEEYQTKQDANFIRTGQIGLAKQHVRNWGHNDWRNELTEIESC